MSSSHMNDKLSQRHLEWLVSAGVDPETISARGYYTESVQANIERLGFSRGQSRTAPVLVIPMYGLDGNVRGHQLHPDNPRTSEGKVCRYEFPVKYKVVGDIPPGSATRVKSNSCRLFITIGIRQADALASRGEATVGLPVASAGKNDSNLWQEIPLVGRSVFIAVSEKQMTNRKSRDHLEFLASKLNSLGARVSLTTPGRSEGEGDFGIDEFLAVGGTVDQLIKNAEVLDPGMLDNTEVGYHADDEGMWQVQARGDEITRRQLSNFSARIVEEITVTDGVENRKEYRVEVALRHRKQVVNLSPDELQGSAWPLKYLGAEAIVFPGYNMADHLRAAIQSLSQDVGQVTVCNHLGWREDSNGNMGFVHAGGVIHPSQREVERDQAGFGPVGPAMRGNDHKRRIEVRAPSGLERFEFPEPTSEEVLINRIRLSFRFLDIAPPKVTFPLQAAIFRPILGPSPYSVMLYGSTGTKKTSLAAVAQQHYGAELDYEHLPGDWDATRVGNEALLFGAKNVLCVLDDFVLRGSRREVDRANRDADSLLRSQANNAGRRRCNSNAQLRPVRPPRGLVLTTAEQLPSGHSLFARLLPLELKKGDINDGVLTECQAYARKGVFAAVTADFIRWVGSRYKQVADDVRHRASEFRDNIKTKCSHARSQGRGTCSHRLRR